MRFSRITTVSLATAALLAIAPVLFSFGPQSNRSQPNPGALGPYEVGHTSFVIQDFSRTIRMGRSEPPLYAPRAIPIHVFYPVDQADIKSDSPQAVYPLDMVYRPTDERFRTYSYEWEAQGIDRAYQSPVPSSAKPFPLVMFSPGWGANAWTALFVGTRLASHGFVVALLYHMGDRTWSYEPDADHLGVASMNRPLDVSFALTNLLQRNTIAGDPLFGLINPDQVAASGWSLGGYAAMALVAGDDLVCDKVYGAMPTDPPASTCVPSPVDSRIKTIVTLDGSAQFLYFHELARITVPMMGLGEEWTTLAAMPGFASWQARLHSAAQGHPAYRVDVSGTIHQSFANVCEATPILFNHKMISQTAYENRIKNLCNLPLATHEAHRLITKYMIAFLKDSLLREPGYQPILTPGYALRVENWIEFFVTEKRSPNSLTEDWPDEFTYFMHQPGSDQARAEKNPKATLPIPYSGYIEEK